MDNRSHQVQTIGILGGGQLGRMLSVAASRLGIKTHIFSPDENSIAGELAYQVTTAEYTDAVALAQFAKSVDVVTFEFENIPAEALDIVETYCHVLPRRNALATSQDRLIEKDFLCRAGLKTAPYANVESQADLAEALVRVGVPAILKTRRFGYDGKGQVRVSRLDQAAGAWAELGHAPCVLEGLVHFDREISVIGARSKTGEIVCFEPGENVHQNGILYTTAVPANISDAQRTDALKVAHQILNALEYVGVMGIELFVTPQEGMIVNEFAPRVHNSGHWTQNGCAIDQFEQHIRAVAEWPLGNGARHSNVVMTNLIGKDVLDTNKLRCDAGVSLHLYGKPDPKPGRKMGHINRITGPA